MAVGEGISEWAVGDKVCALTPGGGYAEYCVTPAAHCLPLPQGLTLLEAASLPENYFTVWNNLFDRVHLAAGETLLVHGGSSGIGLTAIQLAKAFGATVFTTVGGADKALFCRGIGADQVINYREQDFVAEVAAITGKKGVDVVLDMVGGDYIEKNMKCLALEGRMAIIAFLQGSKVTVDWRHIMMKRLTVTGLDAAREPCETQGGDRAEPARQGVAAVRSEEAPSRSSTACFRWPTLPRRTGLMESSAHIGKIMLEVRP